MASFGPIAGFYDDLMHAVPYEMWVDYYELLLVQQDVRPTRFLDVCCGTGTVAEMLAAKGHTVAGFDLSRTMIEQARVKAADKGLPIRYEVADAAEFEMGEQFEAAYSFFDSLNYITDVGRLRMAIHLVSKHLVPGGSFVFDLNTAYAFEQNLFDQHDTRAKAKVKYQWIGEYDRSTRIIRVAMDFWVDGVKHQEVHVQRAHKRDEVESMLIEAGFEEIHVFDSYTLDAPRKRSDRVHYAAIKSR